MAAVAPPETQSWRDTRVGGDSSAPTARWFPPLFPLSPPCGVAWPPVVFLRMSGSDASAGDGHRQGLPRLGDTALADFLGISRDSGGVTFPTVGGCCPQLSSLSHKVLRGIRCSQSPFLHEVRWGPHGSCRVAPWPSPPCLRVWVWMGARARVCVHTRALQWPPACLHRATRGAVPRATRGAVCVRSSVPCVSCMHRPREVSLAVRWSGGTV